MTPSPWQASQRPPLTLNEKRPGPEAARLGVGEHREQLADEREQPRVGRRVGAWRSADRRLIDLDHLVDELDAFDRRVRAGLVAGAIEQPRQRPVENLVDERRLAGAADAGHRRQHAQRNGDVDALQVVGARAFHHDRTARRRTPRTRRLDAAFAAQVRAGHRSVGSVGPVALEERLRRPLEDDVATVLAGAGPKIDDVVGGADRLFVVLDDDDGVAQIAQPRKRREERAIVPLVEANRRLVEHVEDAGEVRSDLRRQADALPFPARERRGAAAERQVADADVVEEMQAIADLAHDAAGDQVLAVGQFQRIQHLSPPRRSAARHTPSSSGP